ncbi:MAG: AAA-like domain-containing protein [Crocosphaera sp.]|nr:AAA-like domain-containing protein [Crocosphaera sp.]
MSNNHPNNFLSNFRYQVGGTLRSNAPSYIMREADNDFYEGLKAGDYCYVFNSRQMGKSSLVVQTMGRLQQDNFYCVAIDLSTIGSQQTTEEKWYEGFVYHLWDEFYLNLNLGSWWSSHSNLSPVQRLSEFVDQILLQQISQNIIIFLDEIDTLLKFDFTDDFLALIRSFYNKRAENRNYNRLSFALIGVTTPNELIKDQQRTPFNIGRNIKLQGFTSVEQIKPLAIGLSEKAKNPKAVLKEVLNWTGGQPFLTQKLCYLIANSPNNIPAQNEPDCVEEVVRWRMISHWETSDSPQHFKTIRARILQSQKNRTIQMLGMYQHILEKGKLKSDGSSEQLELRLTGLIVEDQQSHQELYFKVFNRIYQEIFNDEWVKKQIENLRPYAEKLNNWVASNFQDNSHLLQEDELKQAKQWAEDKSLIELDYQYLSASEELATKMQQKRATKWKKISLISGLFGLIIIGAMGTIFFWKLRNCPFGKIKLNDVCLVVLSSGENILFREERNLDQERGIEAFKQGDYQTAISHFQKAKNNRPNDPEPQIYLNNSLARERGNPFKLAAVVPVDNKTTSAYEILRGVADAQDFFNQERRVNGRLLEIAIVNDRNEENIAKKVAQQLANNKDIIGVIGHNSSEASLAAVPIYERVGLGMISPTSSSTGLDSSVFFRTIPSDAEAAKKLAQYAQSNGHDKVIIFYDNSDNGKNQKSYSISLKEAFETEFEKLGGTVIKPFDINNNQLNIKNVIADSIKNKKVNTLILFPSTKTTSMAIRIAKENAQLPPNQKLTLLGGDSLYSPKTLTDGKSAVQGLVLVIPWANYETKYAKHGEKRWEGRISWRTATSFDAAQALIETIKNLEKAQKQVSRPSILDELRSVNLLAEEDSNYETSGDKLRFWADGNPDRIVRLVQVCKKDKYSLENAGGLAFVPIASTPLKDCVKVNSNGK